MRSKVMVTDLSGNIIEIKNRHDIRAIIRIILWGSITQFLIIIGISIFFYPEQYLWTQYISALGQRDSMNGLDNHISYILYTISLTINLISYLLIGGLYIWKAKHYFLRLKGISFIGCAVGIGLLYFPTIQNEFSLHTLGSYFYYCFLFGYIFSSQYFRISDAQIRLDKKEYPTFSFEKGFLFLVLLIIISYIVLYFIIPYFVPIIQKALICTGYLAIFMLDLEDI